MELEKCENCGRHIGRLETPAVWKDQVVCSECARVLSDAGRPHESGPSTNTAAWPPTVCLPDASRPHESGAMREPMWEAASKMELIRQAREEVRRSGPERGESGPAWRLVSAAAVVAAILGAAMLAGMHVFAGHNSAELRAAEVKAYGAINAIGPWEQGQHAEDSDCRRAEAALAVVAANDGGTPTRIEKLLGDSYSCMSLSRSEADEASQLINANLQASGAGIPPVKGASADQASSSADWDRGLECLRRVENLLRR